MLVAVFSQPISSFAKWKDRGINTLVNSESEGGTVSQAKWRAAASAMGFKYIDRPSANPADDKNDPNLIALAHDDEIDRRIVEPLWNSYKKETDPTKKQGYLDQRNAYLTQFKALSASMRLSGKPVFINISGPHLTGGSYTGENHIPLFAECDWISGDWYPINQGNYPNSHVGLMLDRFDQWAKGKPRWAILECGNILGKQSPTVDDIEAQIKECTSRNIMGICWFPQRTVPSFTFDNLAEPQLSRVIAINRRFNPIVSVPTGPTIEERLTALEQKVKALEARKIPTGATATIQLTY